jgi:hypothetical protein
LKPVAVQIAARHKSRQTADWQGLVRLRKVLYRTLVVLSNREQGPEIVMQMVEDRAPNGFRNLYEVISRQELDNVSNRYKAVAGFDRDRLNSMPSS